MAPPPNQEPIANQVPDQMQPQVPMQKQHPIQQASPPQPQQSSSPQQENVVKVTNVESKLNPNAKEFMPNPTPKNFIARYFYFRIFYYENKPSVATVITRLFFLPDHQVHQQQADLILLKLQVTRTSLDR